MLDMTVTAVGSSAFRGNSALTGVVFPNTLKEIGHFAFAWNSSLSGLLDLPASIEQIGNGAFKQCGFSGMIINGSFATANNNPFDLPSLEFLFIREGANPALASYAFAGCEKLKVAVIPASVTLLPEGAFSGCGELTIITPAGSAAEAWAIENNFPVETATYAVYAAQYESLYPAR
jgi:hypothetical protein